MRLRSIGAVFLGLVLLGFSPASAQERFGAVTGVVTDPSAAPVPGATVTARNKESGKVRSVVTDGSGVSISIRAGTMWWPSSQGFRRRKTTTS